MSYYRRPTPFDIPSFFSAGVGVATVIFVHSHRVGPLIELNALWLAYLAIIYWRARATDGKLLNLPAGFFHGDAIASCLLGLLLSSVYFVVYDAH
jgi:hypothetical protein